MRHRTVGRYASLGNYTDSERILRGLVATYTRLEGPEHDHTVTAMHDLAMSLNDLLQCEEAAELLKKVLEVSA